MSSCCRFRVAFMLTIATAVAGLGMAGIGRLAAAPAQIEAGALATWADLSTWSRPAKAPGQAETGLGLVVTGSSGEMRLAFYVVRPAQGRRAAPSEVGVRAASGALMSPNLLRTPTLTFTSISADEKEELIDVSRRMTVDNPAPGAAVTSGIAALTPEEFLRLASSAKLQALIFGAEVALRADQIDAIRAFRDRVFPPARR